MFSRHHLEDQQPVVRGLWLLGGVLGSGSLTARGLGLLLLATFLLPRRCAAFRDLIGLEHVLGEAPQGDGAFLFVFDHFLIKWTYVLPLQLSGNE